jgi:hypothetical protein
MIETLHLAAQTLYSHLQQFDKLSLMIMPVLLMTVRLIKLN